MSKNSRKINPVNYFLLSGIVETIVVLGVLILMPPDPKNAWLWGYSKTRILTMLSFAVLGFMFWGLYSYLRFKPRRLAAIDAWLRQRVQTAATFIAIGWGLFTFLIFAPYVYIYTQPEIHPIFTRLAPVIVWSFLRCIQAWVGLGLYARQSPRGPVAAPRTLALELDSKSIVWVYGLLAVFFVIINLVYNFTDFYAQDEALTWYTFEFYLIHEYNIPTYFAAIMLWSAAIFAWAVAILKKRTQAHFQNHWVALAAIMTFMSVDEVAGLHELMNRPMHRFFRPTGYFSCPWVVFGVPFVIIVGVFFIKFFLHLPKKYKIIFALAGTLFFTGALGFEMLGAGYTDVNGKNNLMYAVIVTFEEGFEMAGVILLNFGFCEYLIEKFNHKKPLEISFQPQTDEA